MNKRIVFTGVGVMASNGKGKEEFWAALQEGRTGIKPISLFDTSEFSVNMAGEVEDFDPTKYFGPKGLRSLDRSTKLLVSASKLAIADSGFTITSENTDDVGVSVGTTLGSLKSIVDFDEVTLKEGPRYTNPAHFPNTVINSPASQVSIWSNIQGFNTTISTGFTASMDAMSYGYDAIQTGRAKLVYAGGVEELCYPTYYGFYVSKFLSGANGGGGFINCPFDRRRNGIAFGEGAALIAMEELEQAKERGARILGEVLGFGYYFDTFRINKYNPRGTGIMESVRGALDDAGVGPEDIDYICSNANSTKMADKIETAAIKEVFGKRAYRIPVSSIKSMIGECYSVSGAFAVAASLGAIHEGVVPPTVNLKERDPDCDLDYVAGKAQKVSPEKILVINFGPNGSHCCMVLGRYHE